MYFAVQGVINQTIAAVAGAIVVQVVTLLGSSVERPWGTVVIGSVAAVFFIASFFFFAPYPLGQPQPREELAA